MLLPGQFHFKTNCNLGSGGLGTVDEIEVTFSNSSFLVGTRLACKKLNAQWRSHPLARARFENEITAIKSMSHPRIIAYQAENLAGADERFYMMPLYRSTLRHLIAANPAGFSWQSVATYGATIADALSYAHSRGFIHRDLKPENILLDGENNPVIADWGLGYFVHKNSKVLQHLTRGGMGTEYYCSMEQWNTGKCDLTGDVYSLGMTLAELITGQQSAITVGMGIRHDVVLGASTGTKMLNEIIQRMTQLFPQHRYPNMSQVAQFLRLAVAQG